MKTKLFLVLALVLLLTPLVEAGIKDTVKDIGADSVEYIEDHPRIMDFVAFAVLFCAVLMFALAKIGGEGSHWGVWAGFLFGLVLAAVAVASGLSIVKFLGSYVIFILLLVGAIGLFLLVRFILPKNPLAAFLIALVLVVIGVGFVEYIGMTDFIPDFGKNKYARMTFNEVNEEINKFAAEYGVDVSDIDKDGSLNEWRKLDAKIERIRKAMLARLGEKDVDKKEVKKALGDLSDLRDFGGDLAKRIDRFGEGANKYRTQLADIHTKIDEARKKVSKGTLTAQQFEDLYKKLVDEHNKIWLKLKNLVKRSGGIVTLEEKEETKAEEKKPEKKTEDEKPAEKAEKESSEEEKPLEQDY